MNKESLIKFKKKLEKAIKTNCNHSKKRKNRTILGGSEISYENAKDLIRENPNSILVDVRAEQEYREGSLPGFINIPLEQINNVFASQLNQHQVSTHTPIILLCTSGIRSKKAMKQLQENGFQKVYNIKGGIHNVEK